MIRAFELGPVSVQQARQRALPTPAPHGVVVRPLLNPINRGDPGEWLAKGGGCAMSDAAAEWMAHVDAGRIGGR